MVVDCEIWNENGEDETVEVSSEDVRAQVCAMREVAKSVNRLIAVMRVGK